MSLAVADVDGGGQALVTAWLTNQFFTDTWDLARVRIEVTDVGSGAVAAG